ncbi:11564_t:CDS:2 [Funneliformis geosporum]|uniref:5059_t:CDS:1 n=1 Tax=Funneliformis geosporum TaxID=1117311 RepID=A0A9W4SZU4_9GLOM|nr:5059_t:CDS:2 [Funneliformis geosporum]CAI2187553.1 11564_t:CDS:2 [Funneliformis geosporum]
MSDEKRAQRKERNRIAAKECRERRKAYILNLENKAIILEDENLKYRQRIQESKTKLEWIESKKDDDVGVFTINDSIKEDQEDR